MLRAFILTLNNYTGWNMRYPDSRISFVNMLTSRSAGPICIDSYFCGIYLNFNVIVNFRVNEY